MNDYSDPLTENEPAARASLWHRFRPGPKDRHTSFLFWLTVLGLGCVALLCVTWGASIVLAKKGSEKLLRVDLLLPKLKSIHGERKANPFRMSEPEPSELAYPKDRQTPEPAPRLPAVIEHPKVALMPMPRHTEIPPHRGEPLTHSSQPMELTPPPLVEIETCGDPMIFIQQCTLQRGDSPMIRNWKSLTMYSLLAAATATFVAPPPLAFAQDLKTEAIEEVRKSLKDIADRLDKIERKKAPEGDKDTLIKAIGAEIQKLETGVLADLGDKVKDVGEDVKGIKQSVDALKTEQLRQKIDLAKHKGQIDQLTEDVALLRKKLEGPITPAVDKTLDEIRGSLKTLHDTVAKLAPPTPRMSMSPPSGNGITSYGRVMLMNLYSEDLLFEVNGVGHRVPAGKSRLLDGIPVGPVRYLVHSTRWGTLEDRTTSLIANDTFTLTAR